MNTQQKPRFIRRHGKIIPIGVRRETGVAKDIARNSASHLPLISASIAGSLGALYGAGRLHNKFMATGNKKINLMAKFLKFGGVALTGIAGGRAITQIDLKTNDEKSKLFNIGQQATSPLGIAAQLGLAYAGYRLGKRFEYAGKMKLNLFKRENWKHLKSVKDI